MRSIIRRILGAAYRHLAPTGVRNLLSSHLLLTARDSAPAKITDFATGPVLVVAPHFDDEICGCGGVMGLHKTAGSQVAVVFVTDGSAGDPALRAAKLPAEEMAKRKAALSALREAESRAACAEYEVDRFDCLGGPDGNLQPTAALNTAMAQLIADLRPAVIYHPSLLDAHSDHWNTTRILRHALADLPEIAKSVRLRGYEVWMPAIPNRFADITEEMPRKQRAFAHFVSQNATIDYPRAIGGLNTYRSIYFQGGKGYCEAFQELSFAEYETLSDAITAQSQAKPDSHGDPSHS